MESFCTDQNTFRGYHPRATELQGLLPQNSYVVDSRESLCTTPIKRAPMSLYSDSMIPPPPPPESAIDTGGLSSCYTKTDVCTTLERLRLEVEALRDSVAFRSRDKEERVYETIDNSGVKKRNLSHSPSPVYGRPKAWSVARARGFHRLRYVLDPNVNVAVRIFWVLLFLVAVTAMVYQIRDRVLHYIVSPTAVSIETVRVDGLRFPAVTICNENIYRLSASVGEKIYFDISALNKPLDDLGLTVPHHNIQKYNGTYKEILRRVGHRKHDLINSCYWAGFACGPENFTAVFTDYGVCYTFKVADLPLTRKTGLHSGLFLVLNVEQYEYISEAKPPVGVKFVIHDSGSIPRVGEQGVNAAVGAHTSVAVTKVKNVNLPPPVGDCQSPHPDPKYTRAHCLKKCERMLSYKECGCVAPHLETTRNGRPCDVREYFKCVQPWLRGNYRLRKSCECRVECERVTYESFLSHASTSVYAAESIVRTLRLKSNVESRVQLARDMQQRVDPTINEYDTKLLYNVVNNLKHSETNISKYTVEITSKVAVYKVNLQVIKTALKTRNEIVQEHIQTFRDAVHLRLYSSTFNHLVTIFDDIQMKAYNAHKSESITIEKLNETAWTIIDKMRPVIMKTDKFYPSGYIFAEIISGITKFRSDIVFGYGQKYSQFVELRRFYNSTTNKILSLVRSAQIKLTDLYNGVVKTTSDDSLNTQDLRKKLVQFFKDIHAFTYESIPAFKYQFTQLQKTYTQHTKEILLNAKLLEEISTHFDTYYDEIMRGLVSLQSHLTDLKRHTKDLNVNLKNISDEYNEEKFEKTELSYTVSGERIHSSLGKIKATLNKLGILHSLVSSGTSLRDGLSSLSLTRLAGQQRLNLKWLTFDEVNVKVTEILSRLRATSKQVTDYQVELRDYAKGNRLNEDFYMNNFLHLEIYFSDVTETIVEQHQTYNIFDLLCDVGGSLALYLGICLLTLLEAIDLALSICCSSSRRRS